ncbi:MAG TPA: class I SAM-dependent methyltransferase [Treponema sp.]|nr:class I SAM-dependent methyltransferase [Treponema sp.]
MKEIESNKEAWGALSKGHYEHFKKAIQNKSHRFNPIIEEELGDISGKSVIHLQCNTGADTVLLAQKGAIVTGVDLVPENIFYAGKMAQELNIKNIDFIESDIMKLKEHHHKKYDMVFTSEGVLCWLPDLAQWAETIKHLLKENGILYVFDSHPFFMTFDEDKFRENKLEIKYPYFIRESECFEEMGDYCTENKTGVTYEWMYKISDIINPLAKEGLKIEYFNEYDRLFFNNGEMEGLGNGLYHYPFFDKKIPFSFSLKAKLVE